MKPIEKSRDCALLENMKLADKMSFLHQVTAKEKRYPNKTILQLHECDSVGLLLDGIAVLTQIDCDGEEVLTKFISRYHIIDYFSRNDVEDRYELELAAGTTMCWFKRDEFFAYASQSIEITQNIAQCSVWERKFLDRYLAAMSRSKAIDKVHELLQWFGIVYQQTTFVLPISYSKLAHMIGLSRDRFKECLTMLEEQKKIHISKPYHISLLDSEIK